MQHLSTAIGRVKFPWKNSIAHHFISLAYSQDTRVNAAHFPRPFFNGSCHGIWWAFVSMTTVGWVNSSKMDPSGVHNMMLHQLQCSSLDTMFSSYGDKTPKSFFGRLLACIWILAGTILIAIFTAALTTAFSQDTTTDENLFGKQVIQIPLSSMGRMY